MHWLRQRLDRQRQQQRYRQHQVSSTAQHTHMQIDGQAVVNFCSNNYLGLANHPDVTQALTDASRHWGVGSGSAHLINGHSQAHQSLEDALARWTGFPRALLFSTGYMANLAIASALCERGDSILQDRLNHASMIDAGQLSPGQLLRYQHCSIPSLERQLSRANGHSLVMTDGVFSMDGNIAPLPEISQQCVQHQALLMVDDAHGIGVLGEAGRGSFSHFGLAPQPHHILMGTLGKAFGSFGAFVAASEEVIESIIQFGRSYIYTTATPPALAAATLQALRIVQTGTLQAQLQSNIDYFKQAAKQLDLPLMPSDTAIQPLLCGEEQAALHYSQQLLSEGLQVTAIRPPTVPQGSARLRITLSAAHRTEDIDLLLDMLDKHRPNPVE